MDKVADKYVLTYKNEEKKTLHWGKILEVLRCSEVQLEWGVVEVLWASPHLTFSRGPEDDKFLFVIVVDGLWCPGVDGVWVALHHIQITLARPIHKIIRGGIA